MSTSSSDSLGKIGTSQPSQFKPDPRTRAGAQREASALAGAWIFPNSQGGSLDLTNLRELVWRPALRRAGLRYRALYQTRHTFATLALASGEDIGWVARQLGHPTTEMVIRRYHRFIPNLTQRDGSAVAQLVQQEGF